MNPVQKTIAVLQKKGWSLAAIADEMGVSYNAVQKWKAGDRQPANRKMMIRGLESLSLRKRIPKRRRSKPRDGGEGT